MSLMPPLATHRKQRGAALMVMLMVMVVGALTFLVSTLNHSTNTLNIARDKLSAEALEQAKAALVSRAIADADHPGSLPCPDTNDDGVGEPIAGGNCPSHIGRLPWRELGLPDLRDGHGGPLWYALSVNFRDSANPINSDTPGTINLTGTIIENGLAAIVFAPGANLSGQTRSATILVSCVSNPNGGATVSESNCPTNYLEPSVNVAQINTTASNSALSTAAIPHVNYLSDNPSPTFNDHMITIAPEDILIPVEMRIAREAKICLDQYAATSAQKYPWAATITAPPNVGQISTLFGRISDIPNINTSGGISPAEFNAINTALTDLSIAMTACETTDTSATRDALTAAANSLSIANTPADLVGNAITLISLALTADACDDIKDDREPFLTNINTSFSDTLNELNSLAGTNDPEMSVSWPDGCFGSAVGTGNNQYWDNWKRYIFYQVDDQYSPNILPNALPTPSIAINGAGNFRAAVIASRSIVPGGAARGVSDATTYLETTNQHQAAPMAPDTNFNTISPSNLPAYLGNNDLVLCVDGNINCP